MTKVGVGDKAPNFTLQSGNGETVSLSDFLGKKHVVLFFYPMDESPVCSRQAEAFRDSYEAFKQMDAEIIGVSSQSEESHKQFAKHHNLPYILLSDPNNSVRKLYGVSSTLGVVPGRATYVIGKDGIVLHVFSSQFQPAKHAMEALEVLKKQSRAIL